MLIRANSALTIVLNERDRPIFSTDFHPTPLGASWRLATAGGDKLVRVSTDSRLRFVLDERQLIALSFDQSCGLFIHDLQLHQLPRLLHPLPNRCSTLQILESNTWQP